MNLLSFIGAFSCLGIVRMALKNLSDLHMAKCLFWFCMLFVNISFFI